MITTDCVGHKYERISPSIEVSSDDNKVWVNNRGRCKARIGIGGMDWIAADGSSVFFSDPDWPTFVGVMADFGLRIDDAHKPHWVT